MAGLLIWWFWTTDERGQPGEPEGRPGRQAPAPGDVDELSADGPRARSLPMGRSTPELAADPDDEAQAAVEAGTEFVIRGQLVTRHESGGRKVPLPGYTVLLGREGAKNNVTARAQEQVVTGRDGTFECENLEDRGPWNVIVRPMDRKHGEWFRVGTQHLRSVEADLPANAHQHEFEIAVGPIITIRSALPIGVEPSDLLVEAVGKLSPLSSQLGGVGGCAVGQRCEDGQIRAYAPAITNSMHDDGFGIRVTTRDGLFGLAVAGEGKLENGVEVLVDEPLVPRGKVRVKVTQERLREPVSAQRALELGLLWVLPLGDPQRDDLDVPGGLRTGPYGQPPRAISDHVIEIGDLPIGPVEFAATVPRHDKSVEVASPVTATAVHGDPATVTVVLRGR